MEESNIPKINEDYDTALFLGNARGLFTWIGFANLGYWKGAEETMESAQINLIETLVGFFVNRQGNVLDVACGKGASTIFLTKYFDAKKVTAINISEKQLGLCRLVAPECDFRLMDAASLDFPDKSFDNMLCIEAAFYFQTRERFLREAYRVLKPGGRLAMSDVLQDWALIDLKEGRIPKENYLESLHDLKGLLLKAGFSYVRVDDTTEYCLKPVCRFLVEQLEREVPVKPDEIARVIEIFHEQHVASCNVFAIR
jgi:ubiquinone/menaquinone biosynthesis C-methylase UbiE